MTGASGQAQGNTATETSLLERAVAGYEQLQRLLAFGAGGTAIGLSALVSWTAWTTGGDWLAAVMKAASAMAPLYFVASAVWLVLGVQAHRLRVEVRLRRIQGDRDRAKEELRERPEKSLAAWDLAQSNLQEYLEGNKKQTRTVFRATLTMVAGGFGLMCWAVWAGTVDASKEHVALIGAAGGGIVTFIGGTILVMYRSVVADTRSYVTILERINAVGMAVQILQSLDESNKAARDEARREVARDLLRMYGGSIKPAIEQRHEATAGKFPAKRRTVKRGRAAL